MSINYTLENTFIFSFVRMNPPTPGHLLLIKTMIDIAIRLNVNKVYIITSSSLDGKNPLPCDTNTIPKPKNKADAKILDDMNNNNVVYKSSILDKIIHSYKEELINSTDDASIRDKISNIDIHVLCSSGSPFGFIYNVIKNDYLTKGITKINMYFIVGRDRADFLDTIVDNFKTKDYIASIDGTILERTGMSALKNTGVGSRAISDINPTEYSASFVRNLVKNDQRDDFYQVYSKYLSPEDINMLYDSIKLGVNLKSPPSKDEDENPMSKYYDNGRLPIIVSPSGGKKRRFTAKKRQSKSKRKSKKQSKIKNKSKRQR